MFKYTLSGSLLGSWAIDPADTHPTGITINPNNVSDIWIVDNGTDKVSQYIGAASRTSGSQNAGATFALAAGDTNPQGIADPPAPAGAAKPAGAPLSHTTDPSQAPGPQEPPVLVPLSPPDDQDLTLLATELIGSGTPLLAYLAERRVQAPLELWVTPIAPAAPGCGPRVLRSAGRKLAEGFAHVEPAFSADGRWIYACRWVGFKLRVERIAVPVAAEVSDRDLPGGGGTSVHPPA